MEEFVWNDETPWDDWQAPDWLMTTAERRRLKALLVLLVVWGTVFLLHQWPGWQWLVFGLALLVLVYITWLFNAEVEPELQVALSEVGIPTVTILIPAKNEALVLPQLLANIDALDYPHSHLDVWVIDDASTDQTPMVLAALQSQYAWFRSYRRAAGAGGGKSGALNEVLPLTSGLVVVVFDADAHVPADVLQRALPLLQSRAGGSPVGAVQIRKAVMNASHNIWTRGQAAEMALDSFLQQQRVAVGGVGELRGNGQLVYRALLDKCGGWNESTLTDDLDLTFKLHLAGVEIAFLMDPPVQEEGVTGWWRLWHQRNRWAEGGYQRFLDYWPGLVGPHLPVLKRLDLAVFFLNQYLLPMALVPDMVWGLWFDQPPMLWPLGIVAYGTMLWSLWQGLRHTTTQRGLALWSLVILALVYMVHWIPVMVTTTARLCVQPKRLKWIKTEHQGHHS